MQRCARGTHISRSLNQNTSDAMRGMRGMRAAVRCTAIISDDRVASEINRTYFCACCRRLRRYDLVIVERDRVPDRRTADREIFLEQPTTNERVGRAFSQGSFSRFISRRVYYLMRENMSATKIKYANK